ncbi:tRNA (uridine(34)/cytosine(34)/5-carboxymethylaminomethyluridine(34)-2'-O)-methyltransferase TrmL [Marinicella sp. W31]|uniref:tRNA (uridine(34)/cytosine(34)/5- carboxymethylaminomethyluridine(34)-2'-O)- methyltransferase TrmL n=1 Tax=Marinicella sp. W31 TaxID=3023713 RepID=UPI003756ACB0
MFNLALFQPQIPPNTGNAIRLVANNGCHLHLIEPLGFNLDEKPLRRAGLDYHDLTKVTRHASFEKFAEAMKGNRIFAITTKGNRTYTDIAFKPNDVFIFGSETAGLPQYVFDHIKKDNWLRIPMVENNRSMNLSNTVALVSYEAWRQHNFLNGE